MTEGDIWYIMLIGYSNKDVDKLCNNEKVANKKLGNKVAKKLFQRLQWLAKAPDLDFFNRSFNFLRLHKLKGNYDGMYALDIDNQYRLIFYPSNETGEPDWESDFKAISIVMVQEVNKHYE